MSFDQSAPSNSGMSTMRGQTLRPQTQVSSSVNFAVHQGEGRSQNGSPPPSSEADHRLGGLGQTVNLSSTQVKRDSLRTIAPLMRRVSQELRTSAWITLNGPKSKEGKVVDTAVSKFNQKPTAGIEHLVFHGVIRRTPEEVAAFIHSRGGELSKRKVGEFVGSLDPLGQEVLDKLLQDYDFSGLSLDDAMRELRFPGESQQIDRILQRFACRYFDCNQDTFATEDVVYILSFSIVMLNTDLHNRHTHAREKMKLEEFIRNNRGINEGRDLPKELLTTIYQSIKHRELRMREGDMYETKHLTFQAPRISGWLWKKDLGNLGLWKQHWFILTGSCLYYFSSPDQETPLCIIALEGVTAVHGEHEREIRLYSDSDRFIKSVKFRRSDKRMVQGEHKEFILRTATVTERDDWFEALQRETVEGPTLRSVSQVEPMQSQPKKPTGHGARETIYDVRGQGWMRRRSDVTRAWQRRFFMLVSRKSESAVPVVGLYWFTTEEMQQRFLHLGIRTEQGMISLDNPGQVNMKTPLDVITYRPPSPSATVFEIGDGRRLELVSPEDVTSLGYWLDVFNVYLQREVPAG